MHRPPRSLLRLQTIVPALLSISAALSCTESTAFIDPASGSPTDTTDTTASTLRATLTIRIAVDAADSVLATAIGSPGGVLRGAQVSITRGGTTPLGATTDSTGAVTFLDLLPGTYSVTAGRTLVDTEVVLLGAGNADVAGFGGGAFVSVSAPATSGTIVVVAGHRGSLVISELLMAEPRAPSGEYYSFGSFLEVFNNSDTTIYLDGKLVGTSLVWVADYPSPRSCAEMVKWREDPAGIWSRFFYAFPGTGRTHPLAAGKTAVIATDAIDHSAIVRSLPDLSRADFEFVGPSDVDNPDVPNMINVGPGEWASSVFGHGLFFGGIRHRLRGGLRRRLDLAARLPPCCGSGIPADTCREDS